MGEAKRRGTFEERKAQAIEQGRKKVVKARRGNAVTFQDHMFAILIFRALCMRKGLYHL